VTCLTNGTYNVSLYVKAGTSARIDVTIGSVPSNPNSNSPAITFSGGVPTIVNAHLQNGKVTDVGSGWYRVSVDVYDILAASTNTLYIYPALNGSDGETVIVWGVQMTAGTGVALYQKTTTTASFVDAHRSQRHYQFTKLDGTEYTVWIVGGKILTYNWTTETWSEPVTTANLTTAAITLSTTARVYCKTFANTLLISDGVNVPFTWDGTAGAGGLVKLTNAPVFFGQPEVYYGKIAAIKNTERNTWVWSEEATANTGYEAGGYNNAWTLGQTDQEGFYALAATDSSLTFLRREGITQVIGRITDDFQTTGTLDAVSQTVGTLSPAAVYVYDRTIYFPGSDQRFYKIVGSQLTEVAIGGRGTFGGASRLRLSNALVAPWSEGDLIIFGIAEASQEWPNLFFAVNPANDELAGLWRGWACTTLDGVKDGNGVGALVHGGGPSSTVATGTSSLAGWAYLHGNPDGVLWDDGFADATVAISHRLTPGYLGFDVRTDKHFYQVDVSLLTPTDLESLTIESVTQRGAGSTLTVTVVGTGSTEWDNFDWDDADWAGESTEQHVDCGLRRDGRWLKLTLGHAAIGERFQPQAVLVRAFRLDQRARML
jgi:hypothetical protein